MSEILEIDGISLRGQGFGAVTRQGRYSIPGRRGENYTVPGGSGVIFTPNKPFDEGLGALTLWAIGATTDSNGEVSIPSTYVNQRQQFENNMASLMRLFTRGHRLSTIRAGQPDGSIRRAQVEWREWSDPDIQAGATRAEWAIAYTIPKVFWEDENPTTQAASAGATLPKVLPLTAFAGMTGVIEDAVFTVSGPITNPRITEGATGAWVQYTGTIANGDTWVVDSGAFTSVATGVGFSTSTANTTHGGAYRLLPISNEYNGTNTPQLTLTGTGGGAATNLSVTARRKWISG